MLQHLTRRLLASQSMAVPGLIALLLVWAAAATGQIRNDDYRGYEGECSSCREQLHDGAPPPPGFTIILGPGAVLENILVGPSTEQDAAAALVAEFRGQVLRVSPLPALGQFTMIAAFPNQQLRGQFATALDQRLPETGLSVHWNYRFAQAAPRLYGPQLIGDPGPGGCRLPRPVRIGMIDGPVNTAHPALRGARITHESLVQGRVPAAHHGTGVAALLIGEDATGILSGYARGAELRAVSIFRQTEDGEETSGELVALAIDRLVGQGVQIINMSFAGPESNALRRALAAAAARGVVMVGAAGNNRARAVSFPASDATVVAVTAVDAARQRFRLANVGAENEFSAPGVDVYAARENGGGYVSGTSFAAPVVTALIAREMARGTTGARNLRTRLQAGVEVLGPGGRSPEFGWGLARATSC